MKRKKEEKSQDLIPLEPSDGYRDLGELLYTAEMPSAIKEFVHPGKEIGELLMRSRLTRREAQLVTLALYKAEKFDIEPLKSLLLNYLAIQCSVDGTARKELRQAVVGMVVPAWGQRFSEKQEKK